MTAARDHLTGGPAVDVEPHAITRLLTPDEKRAKGLERLDYWCATCEGRLVYGRDGKYRHRRGPRRPDTLQAEHRAEPIEGPFGILLCAVCAKPVRTTADGQHPIHAAV